DLPQTHEKRNLATPSPVTDGAIIYAWFSNGQLAAVDMSGKLVWSRHLGREYSAISVGPLVNLGDQKVHKMVKFCVHQCTQTARRYEAPSLLLVGQTERRDKPACNRE